MLKQLLSTLILLFSSVQLIAQSNSSSVVAEVGDETILYQELINNYTNSDAQGYSLSELEDFLPAYALFVAKLKEGKKKGYYQNEKILDEHKLYSKQAAYSYWLDKLIKPTKFDLYSDRYQKELKASHILISHERDPNIEGPAQAKEMIIKAKEELSTGTPFEAVNNKYSSRQNGQLMGGELPWISVGTTVPEFENALYELERGEISDPVITQFGIHVIRLEGVRDRIPARKVKHIFIRPSRDSTAYNRAQMAYASLENGRPWADVVSQFTQDDMSKSKAGDIGWIDNTSNFRPGFLSEIMTADTSLSYSKPFSSPYGFHIIKIDSVRTFHSEEEKVEAIRKEFNESPYFKKSNTYVVQFIQETKNAKVDADVLKDLEVKIASADTSLIRNIELPSSSLTSVIYSFGSYELTAGDYFSYLRESRSDKAANTYSAKWFDDFKMYAVDQRIVEMTLSRYDEFQEQIDSYLDGLVVYELNNDYMWSAETVDTTAMKEFYYENTERYTLPSRPFYYMITAKSDSALQNAIGYIENSNDPDSLKSAVNNITVKADSSLFYEEPPYNRLAEMKESSFSEIFLVNNRKAVFYMRSILKPRVMGFKEAFDRVLSDYQQIREEKWTDYLIYEYDISYNMETLKTNFEQQNGL